MITTISGKNIKGTSFEESLGKITVFVGPNASGKTARLDALRLALWGYLPEIGKQAGVIAGLSSDPVMEVSATYNKNTIRRTWTKTTARVSAKKDGVEPNLPTEMLSASTFFDMSPAKRTEYLFGMSPINERKHNKDALVFKLRSIRLDGWSKFHETALQSVIDELPGGSFSAKWIEEAIEQITSASKDSAATYHREVKAIESEAATDIDEILDVGRCEKKLNELKDNLRKAEESYRDALDAKKKQRKLEEEKVELKKKLVTFPASDQDTLAGRVDTLRKEISSYKSETNALHDQLREIDSKIRGFDAMADENDRARSRATEVERLRSLSKAHKKEIASLDDRVRKLIESVQAKKEVLKDVIEQRPDTDDTCELCGTNMMIVWAANKKAAEAEVKSAESELNPVSDRISALQNDILSNEKEVTRLTEVGIEVKEIDDMSPYVKQAQEIEDALVDSKAKDHEISKKHGELSDLQSSLADIRVSQEIRKTMEERLRELNMAEDENIDALTVQADSAKEVMAELPEQIREANKKHKQAIGQQQNVINLNKKKNMLKELEAIKDVRKEAAKMVAEYQADVVRDSIEPVIQRARLITDGILRTRLDYKNGDIGRQENGSWISQKYFSGTEQALAYVAFCYALTPSGFKLVILDEMGRIDLNNKNKFIKIITTLVAKKAIDQFICIDVDDTAYTEQGTSKALSGVTLIRT